ncbi:MAG: hypothetical protein KF878_10690 [Planctomycetes bacterium]|nr:hypothetical protein [Planctomycetota bacterium]
MSAGKKTITPARLAARREDVRLAAARCPFCHDDVHPDAGDVACVACERCLARHHEACWDEARRCGACGVGSRRARRHAAAAGPGAAPRARGGRRADGAWSPPPAWA